MYVDSQHPKTSWRNPIHEDHAREQRIERLIQLLPKRLQGVVRRLRQPSARWIRIPVGLLFIIGGLCAILPILGLWMLPLGLALLAEDVPPLRRGLDRILLWIERHRPHWLGMPRQSPLSQQTESSRHGDVT